MAKKKRGFFYVLDAGALTEEQNYSTRVAAVREAMACVQQDEDVGTLYVVQVLNTVELGPAPDPPKRPIIVEDV